MDWFGDGGLGGVSVSATASLAAAVTTDQEKWYGSGVFKQEISATNAEGDSRGLKVAKTAALDDFSAPKAIQRTSSLRSNSYLDGHGQQMFCFSSPNSPSVTFPFCHPSSNAYTKNAGTAYGIGGLNSGSMQGSKGLFTPSQWMELEHQALVYKYIIAKVPIPSSLLTPIRKALDSAGFSSFMGLKPSSYGWSALHLGFSSKTDPEPGRCRRTDGKKWRCSKDAMADHKYCERHMNRGRHRSRKLVEGQAGHPVSGTTSCNTKVMAPTASTTPAIGDPAGGASNSLGLAVCQQLNNTRSQSSASGPGNRSFLDRENFGRSLQDITGLSMISPAANLRGNQYSIPRQEEALHGSSGGEFGQVCSDSLLNPFDKSSSLVGCNSYDTSEDSKDMISKSQNGLREFFAEWPNNSQSECVNPDIDMHTERTRLSISIPMTASDFMSSTWSPTNERAGLSPSKCSQDLDAARVGLVGTKTNERNPREASWIPITWESSAGGPLGEVLHSTNNSSDESKTLSGLNLMTGWDDSQSLVSSPTGVLQKTAFVSLSNSSAGSSPRVENSKAHEGASLLQ